MILEKWVLYRYSEASEYEKGGLVSVKTSIKEKVVKAAYQSCTAIKAYAWESAFAIKVYAWKSAFYENRA